MFELARQLIHFPLACLHLTGQFAQFALERQWTAGILPASGDRMAVIAHAILQQEIAIRVAHREMMRGAAIGNQKASRQPRE